VCLKSCVFVSVMVCLGFQKFSIMFRMWFELGLLFKVLQKSNFKNEFKNREKNLFCLSLVKFLLDAELGFVPIDKVVENFILSNFDNWVIF